MFFRSSYITFFLIALVSALPVAESESVNAVSKEFNIQTVVTEGNAKLFGGLLLTSFHTGAGENAVVGTHQASQTSPFTINNTYVTQMGGSPPYPYTFGLVRTPPYNSSAPNDYLYVSENIGTNTRGFELSGPQNYIEYTGPIPFETFTICKVDGVSPYYSVGPQLELLWRKTGSKAKYNKCADVKLQAVFVK